MSEIPFSRARARARSRRQHGVALVVALLFLMVITLLGVTIMQDTGQQEMMASNTRQRNLAFQGAEACLRYGESGWGASGDGLDAATLPLFDDQARPGLRQPITAAEIGTTDIATFWSDIFDWDRTSQPTSQACPLLSGVSQAPRFVIEELQLLTPPGSSVKFGPLPATHYYRVTARSQGGTADAIVIVQTIYRR